MTKEQKATVVEYASSLSEEDVRFLTVRLTERLAGDLAEALEFLSKSNKIDAILSSAASATELFTLADQIRDVLVKECKKKGVSLRHVANAA